VLTHAINVLLSGMFHAAILFLVAAGLQLVFGVQRIFNLACGSFYALGAYTGVSAVNALIRLGLPHELFLLALLGAGVGLAIIGPLIGLDHGIGHWASMSPQNNERLLPNKG
jgi:branched-chain amino acid transport system permease protein